MLGCFNYGDVFSYFGCVVVPLTYGSKLLLSLFYFFRPTPLVREGLKKLVLGLSQHCQRHDAAPYITPDLLTWLRAHKQKHRQSKNQKHNILKDNSAICNLFTALHNTKAQQRHKKNRKWILLFWDVGIFHLLKTKTRNSTHQRLFLKKSFHICAHISCHWELG